MTDFKPAHQKSSLFGAGLSSSSILTPRRSRILPTYRNLAWPSLWVPAAFGLVDGVLQRKASDLADERAGATRTWPAARQWRWQTGWIQTSTSRGWRYLLSNARSPLLFSLFTFSWANSLPRSGWLRS